MRCLLGGAVLSLVMAAAATAPASAQTWPERPVRFITSQAAGNATDIIAAWGRVVREIGVQPE